MNDRVDVLTPNYLGDKYPIGTSSYKYASFKEILKDLEKAGMKKINEEIRHSAQNVPLVFVMDAGLTLNGPI